MDLQTYLNNAVAASRKATLDKSDQLTLGELILKLEPIADRKREHEATVKYDFEYLYPSFFDSWRGSYNELALDICGFGREDYKPLTVSEFLKKAKQAIGQEFYGYKSGTYTMNKNTPIWIANYGNAGSTALIDVVDNEYEVILITGLREF